MATPEPPAPRRDRVSTSRRAFTGGVAAAVVLAILLIVVAVVPSLRGGAADALEWAGDRWSDATTELRSVMEELPERQLAEQRQLAGSESLLIVITDADNRTVAITLLGRSSADDATTVLIPPGLFDLLPGYGDRALSDATVFESPELLQLAISNLLGVRIDGIVKMGPGDLTTAIPGPITVTLSEPLIVEDGEGVGTFVAESGAATYDPSMLEVLMVTRGTSDPLAWLERQSGVWEALMLEVESNPNLAPGLAAFATSPGDVERATRVIAGTAADGPGITVIPLERVAVTGTEAGFTVPFAAAAALVDSRMPHLDLADGERTRVEVLNGNGGVLATRKVAETLIRRGFRVIITDNADRFDYETTLVIAQGRDNRSEAERARLALGVGDLQLELRAPSGVIDVSIIVGLDIPAGEG
jgi:hypothetical protein